MIDQAVLDKLQAAGEGLAELGKALGPGSKHTTPTGTPTTNYMTGPAGVFGVSGLENTLIHTLVQAEGLASFLPAFRSSRTDPLVPYLTGVRDVTGTQADGVCDDPEVAGLVKGCITTAQFGRYSFMTKELELNRLGQQIDRGELQDQRLLNNPLVDILKPITPDTPLGEQVMNDVSMAFTTLALAFQRKLLPQVWIGNPANNSVGGGYKEFPGLDILIGTGKVDALTNTACPSLDSDIKNFNYLQIDENGNAIVNAVTYMARFLKKNARTMNFVNVEWAIVMREELFYELTAVWPCSYLTYRCVVNDNNQDRLNVSANDQVEFRDQMRRESWLLIDGVRWNVILDDGITEETDADSANLAAGQFASDIYFVPLSGNGMAFTFWEFFEYTDNRHAEGAMGPGNYDSSYWISDGGRFLWHNKPPVNWCVQWLAKMEPRMRLLTPQLAGRIQNVAYEPLQHTRQPLPDDPYYVNGGVVVRTGPSYYTEWNV